MKSEYRGHIIPAAAVILIAAVMNSAIADSHPPVSLSIVQPNSNGDYVLLSESGWGLTLKMVVKEEDMVGIASVVNWPNKSAVAWGGGYILLEDPDGCVRIDDPDWLDWFPIPLDNCTFDGLGEGPDNVVNEPDETYLEFRPDTDEAGVPDSSGDAGELLGLVDGVAGGDGPEFDYIPPEGDGCQLDMDDEDCAHFGPFTGGAEVDGWGYGNDDDLPGLFLWTEAGTGLVYQEPAFERTDPLGVRNLAGMINSVSYDLSDITKSNSKEQGQRGKPTVVYTAETRVWAHMNLPRELVRNVMQYDACVGEAVDLLLCDGLDQWRIDGGAVEDIPEDFNQVSTAIKWKLDNTMFTVHAFMVSGHAPDMLFDADGDGDYADDAEAAGYTVISNVDSIDLMMLSNESCTVRSPNAMYADLDGNGESREPIVCPPGPGDVRKPPR